MKTLHFWVAGGDMRQVKLARLLGRDGHRVHTFAMEDAPEKPGEGMEAPTLSGIREADCVILPLPTSDGEGNLTAPLCGRTWPLEEIFSAMGPGRLAVGGRLDGDTRALAEGKGVRLEDYFLREELAVANAVPTAEGALQVAMENLPITLHGARTLVVGYGRIGRVLARQVRSLGGRVTVAARRYEHLAWAEADGCEARRLRELGSVLPGCDLILNTVPARVLGEGELTLVRRECLIVDVASKPGGGDV